MDKGILIFTAILIGLFLIIKKNNSAQSQVANFTGTGAQRGVVGTPTGLY